MVSAHFSGPDKWADTIFFHDAGGEFRVSPALGRRLAGWWRRQSLRPGGPNERLPLDDPSADPQRQAAVEAVARLLEQKAQARAK